MTTQNNLPSSNTRRDISAEYIYLFDIWRAIDLHDYDGAPDAGPQCVGEGKTKDEAIADLMRQFEEREEERAARRNPDRGLEGK